LVYQLERSIKKRGKDYRKFSVEEKKTTAAALSIAAAVKAILDTPILTQQGKLTKASRIIANDVRKQITGGEAAEDKASIIVEDDTET
jgi:CHASE3 domain sensor protein